MLTGYNTNQAMSRAVTHRCATARKTDRLTQYATAQISTLRIRVLKVGAKVVQTCRRLWLQPPTGGPAQALWARLCQWLTRARGGAK